MSTETALESLRALSFLMPQGPAPEEYPIRVVALEDALRVLAAVEIRLTAMTTLNRLHVRELNAARPEEPTPPAEKVLTATPGQAKTIALDAIRWFALCEHVESMDLATVIMGAQTSKARREGFERLTEKYIPLPTPPTEPHK